MSPLALFKLQNQMTGLMLEAQTVMALRILGMSGAIPADKHETFRMFAEKGPALAQAYTAGAQAMIDGKRPDQIVKASLKPLRKKVRANRKRLLR